MTTKPTPPFRIAVIGGGAAGFFFASEMAECSLVQKIDIFESTSKTLTKVKISGGGRCNVTHQCFDPKALVQSYPRGHRELLSVFKRFQPKDTLEWFGKRGVKIIAEPDGRMFPSTHQSQTIIDALSEVLNRPNVHLHLSRRVTQISRMDQEFEVTDREGTSERYTHVMMCTGSQSQASALLEKLGHQIEPLVPSLFTFAIDDPKLHGLSGLSVPTVQVRTKIEGKKFSTEGPLLVTHRGLSGPAILKLSAWAARELHQVQYQFEMSINFLAAQNLSADQFSEQLKQARGEHPKAKLAKTLNLPIPKRLLLYLIYKTELNPDQPIGESKDRDLNRLAESLSAFRFQVTGQNKFKDEFVTCGGVSLKEVNFSSLESRIQPGLYFAGEVLDIDAVTGGFNFQAAWSTAWVAAQAIRQTKS